MFLRSYLLHSSSCLHTPPFMFSHLEHTSTTTFWRLLSLQLPILTRQCWLDSLHKKSLTDSFLIIPETSIHQHLLDLVAKFVLPLPFILLQILLLRFVWWVILYCRLWRVERLTQALICSTFFSLPFLSEFFSMETSLFFQHCHLGLPAICKQMEKKKKKNDQANSWEL